MVSEQSRSIAERAKAIYSIRLQIALEAKHLDRFVAIEPDSGHYFLADSYGQAVNEARKAHPDRISFVIRIGHDAAIHIGGMTH